MNLSAPNGGVNRGRVTSLGPWLNVTIGVAEYPWRRFVLWDVLGDVLWVVSYVMVGYIFSDRVQAISQILGNLIWVILGLIVAVILGWEILQYLRPSNAVHAVFPKISAGTKVDLLPKKMRINDLKGIW